MLVVKNVFNIIFKRILLFNIKIKENWISYLVSYLNRWVGKKIWFKIICFFDISLFKMIRCGWCIMKILWFGKVILFCEIVINVIK